MVVGEDIQGVDDIQVVVLAGGADIRMVVLSGGGEDIQVVVLAGSVRIFRW